MVYRWNLEGTALEFPTPYQVENRFLTLRGYALIALALLVAVVLTFVGEDESARPVLSLDKLPEPASVWPHVLAALAMATWGVMNLLQASRQRVLLMVPGQPASLMSEVPHEAAGASPQAGWLTQAMVRGAVSAAKLTGPYASWLGRISRDAPWAPMPLLAYLRVRVSHLLCLLGLALLLALLVAVSAVLGKPAAPHLAALVIGLLLSLVLVRHALQPADGAWPAWAMVLVLVLALALAGPLVWFAQDLPWADKWPRLGLPTGVGLLLALGLLLEALALQCARQQVRAPRGARVAPEERSLQLEADLSQLFNEIDRELFRRWAEGIPSRRYTRQPPVVDPASEEGNFQAAVLEESQPLVPPPVGEPGRAPGSPAWLMALGALGLLLSVAGGLLWLWLAFAHMRDPAASWVPAVSGLVCLTLGGYALMLGHLLWSRMEAGSTLTWLELKGSYFRVPGAVPAAVPAGRRSAETVTGVEGFSVKACIVHARSVFYAAGAHGPGSRALVSLTGDGAAATAWIQGIQNLARNAGLSPAAATPSALAARAKARERRAAAEMPSAPKRPARFCSACGTPLLAGARFCQQCGSTVTE